MKMKKQSYNSHYGNKGLIFTLDAAVAVIIVLVLLAGASVYISKSGETYLPRLQGTRTANDIITIMDYQNSFSNLDENSISTRIQELLPSNYNMKLYINSTLGEIETSEELPKDKFISTGERVLVIEDDYAIARFWIWLK